MLIFTRITLNFRKFQTKSLLSIPKIIHIKNMSHSMYEYVREYEQSSDTVLLNDTFIVVRVDGRGFHRFSKDHKFKKPNDKRCLDLMIDSALHVMRDFYPHIIISYGESDEFSFVFRRSSNIFNRRQNKITSLIVSLFTSAYVFNWTKYFSTSQSDSMKLLYPPSFDGRCVLYPNEKSLIDYLKWRQVDCHVNNLYNTTFYALTGEYTKYIINDNGDVIISELIHPNKPEPLTATDATKKLEGTVSSDKHEILFQNFGINYNNEFEQFKKGTVLLSEPIPKDVIKKYVNNKRIAKKWKNKVNDNGDDFSFEKNIKILNVNIIDDKFWAENKVIFEI